MPLPFIDAGVAVSVGRRAVPPGPELPLADLESLVDGLRQAAAASVGPVEEVTQLSFGSQPTDAAIIDRATWVEANVTMALAMLAEASGDELPEPVTMRDTIAGRANGAQVGAALAVFGSRILGQYLPFAATPRLVVVAPNVAKIERELGVDPRDFRLWVCLHERTHHLQFAHAPWLREHLARKVGDLLDDEDGEGTSPRPKTGSLIDVMATPRQRAVFDEVSAIMSLLEGYADDMMDRVGPSVVPSVVSIRSRFEQRRSRGGLTRLLNKAIGMDLKYAQYAEGAAFCRAVIDRVGVSGLNVAYESPGLLPTLDEIREPGRWVTRVHS